MPDVGRWRRGRDERLEYGRLRAGTESRRIVPFGSIPASMHFLNLQNLHEFLSCRSTMHRPLYRHVYSWGRFNLNEGYLFCFVYSLFLLLYYQFISFLVFDCLWLLFSLYLERRAKKAMRRSRLILLCIE